MNMIGTFCATSQKQSIPDLIWILTLIVQEIGSKLRVYLERENDTTLHSSLTNFPFLIQFYVLIFDGGTQNFPVTNIYQLKRWGRAHKKPRFLAFTFENS